MLAVVIVLAILAALILALTSCATYAAVTEAPVEFWVTAEEIVMALLSDLWALVEFLL